MKKIIFLLIFITLSSPILTAQKTIGETEKLASLGKVYGFLKYYHPRVAKGEFNWDKQLIKQIPQVLEATDKQSLSKIYLDWIDNLGEIEICKKCDSKENYFDKNFNLSWSQDSLLFTNELSAKLMFIEKNRNQGYNHYALKQPIGNIKPTNESTYSDINYPSEEYRLLGLFKYWNIIEYFYPYKYLTDQDWHSVLREIIPKIRKTTNKNEYQPVLKELVAKLDDSHAWINFNEKYNFLPVKITHVENKAVVSSFYNESLAKLNNLKLGDVILKVNGKNVKTELNNTLKYVSASNLNSKINKSLDNIFRRKKEEKIIELTIERGGQIKTIAANLYGLGDFDYLQKKSKIKSKSINDAIGYINMASHLPFKEFDDIFELFKSKKTIIIDLRGYPEFRYKMFTRYFNREDRVFALTYSPDINFPGRFKFNKDIETGSSRKAFNGKFILLVNEDSLSLSEFTAMAFQTVDNLITVGNQTAGADGDVVVFEYIGGYRTAMSGNGIMYPDGTESQRKGVKIDVEIKPSINGLRQGRDEVLEKAIEIASKY